MEVIEKGKQNRFQEVVGHPEGGRDTTLQSPSQPSLQVGTVCGCMHEGRQQGVPGTMIRRVTVPKHLHLNTWVLCLVSPHNLISSSRDPCQVGF